MIIHSKKNILKIIIDQIRQNFIQRLPLNNDQPLADQPVQNQQRLPTLNYQSSTDLNNGKQDNQQQQQSMLFSYHLIIKCSLFI